MSLLGVGFNIR